MSAGWLVQAGIGRSTTRLWDPDVHRFFRANVWHVEGSERDMIVDFGPGLRPLTPALRSDADKPRVGVATHAHLDHVGAFHEFAERAGHWREAGGFAAMGDQDTLAHLFREMPEAVSKPPRPGWRQEDHTLVRAPLTRRLYEGDKIDLGDLRFQVLHLPGHSPGSIGLLERSQGILFSGDAIYSGTLVDDVPGSDVAAYRLTMERLEVLDVDVVYAGHNEPLAGAQMKSIAQAYLRDRKAGVRGIG